MNFGQVCTAGSRILVQEGIADEFIKEFVSLMESVKVGDPFDPKTTQGPLNSSMHFDRVMGWVQVGQKEGASTPVCGKDLRQELGGGYYISPTVFTDLQKDSQILSSEVFGPVVSIQRFKTEEEAIEEANRTTYGLASAVFSSNHERILRMNEAIRAGTVWNNLYNFSSYAIPFGGFKQSGIGREVSGLLQMAWARANMDRTARLLSTTTSRPSRSSPTWVRSAPPWPKSKTA